MKIECGIKRENDKKLIDRIAIIIGANPVAVGAA